jgi:hypothetical protein
MPCLFHSTKKIVRGIRRPLKVAYLSNCQSSVGSITTITDCCFVIGTRKEEVLNSIDGEIFLRLVLLKNEEKPQYSVIARISLPCRRQAAHRLPISFNSADLFTLRFVGDAPLILTRTLLSPIVFPLRTAVQSMKCVPLYAEFSFALRPIPAVCPRSFVSSASSPSLRTVQKNSVPGGKLKLLITSKAMSHLFGDWTDFVNTRIS